MVVADSRDGFVMKLLLSQADMRVRTDLAWLDLVESEVSKRFSDPSSGAPPGSKAR